MDSPHGPQGAGGHGLVIVQEQDGKWTLVGDEATAPRFKTRQYALAWLACRVRSIEAAQARRSGVSASPR